MTQLRAPPSIARALCVGCNYPMRTQHLAGACADAFWFASLLKDKFRFQEIRVLHDHDVKRAPGTKRNAWNPDPETVPTRANVLTHLRWLVANAKPDDVLVFFFSGFGAQIDNATGFENEGLHEALLATDPDLREAGILLSEVHDLVTNVCPGAHVHVFLDCDGGGSLLDRDATDREGARKGHNGFGPQTLQNYSCGGSSCGSGSGSSASSSASKRLTKTQKSALCGLVPVGYAEQRVQEVFHDSRVWYNDHLLRNGEKLKVKQKYVKKLEIAFDEKFCGFENPGRSVGSSVPSAALRRAAPMVFSLAASQPGQTAVELFFEDVQREHGVFTYCLVRALERYCAENQVFGQPQTVPGACRGTHAELLRTVEVIMETEVRGRILPSLDQRPALSCTQPYCCPEKAGVLLPLRIPEHLPEDLPPAMRERLLRFFPRAAGGPDGEVRKIREASGVGGGTAFDHRSDSIADRVVKFFAWVGNAQNSDAVKEGSGEHGDGGCATPQDGRGGETRKSESAMDEQSSAEESMDIPAERATLGTRSSVLPTSFFPTTSIFDFEPPQQAQQTVERVVSASSARSANGGERRMDIDLGSLGRAPVPVAKPEGSRSPVATASTIAATSSASGLASSTVPTAPSSVTASGSPAHPISFQPSKPIFQMAPLAFPPMVQLPSANRPSAFGAASIGSARLGAPGRLGVVLQ